MNDGFDESPNMSTAKLFMLSTVLAIIITIPAVILTLVLLYVFKVNIITTMIIGILTFLVTMGFGFKISKRLPRGRNMIDM